MILVTTNELGSSKVRFVLTCLIRLKFKILATRNTTKSYLTVVTRGTDFHDLKVKIEMYTSIFTILSPKQINYKKSFSYNQVTSLC